MNEQTPPAHMPNAFGGAQRTPQPPQFATSVIVFTQAVPQSVPPAAQEQSELRHASLGPHIVPHAPQFSGSTIVFAHALHVFLRNVDALVARTEGWVGADLAGLADHLIRARHEVEMRGATTSSTAASDEVEAAVEMIERVRRARALVAAPR